MEEIYRMSWKCYKRDFFLIVFCIVSISVTYFLKLTYQDNFSGLGKSQFLQKFYVLDNGIKVYINEANSSIEQMYYGVVFDIGELNVPENVSFLPFLFLGYFDYYLDTVVFQGEKDLALEENEWMLTFKDHFPVRFYEKRYVDLSTSFYSRIVKYEDLYSFFLLDSQIIKGLLRDGFSYEKLKDWLIQPYFIKQAETFYWKRDFLQNKMIEQLFNRQQWFSHHEMFRKDFSLDKFHEIQKNLFTFFNTNNLSIVLVGSMNIEKILADLNATYGKIPEKKYNISFELNPSFLIANKWIIQTDSSILPRQQYWERSYLILGSMEEVLKIFIGFEHLESRGELLRIFRDDLGIARNADINFILVGSNVILNVRIYPLEGTNFDDLPYYFERGFRMLQDVFLDIQEGPQAYWYWFEKFIFSDTLENRGNMFLELRELMAPIHLLRQKDYFYNKSVSNDPHYMKNYLEKIFYIMPNITTILRYGDQDSFVIMNM